MRFHDGEGIPKLSGNKSLKKQLMDLSMWKLDFKKAKTAWGQGDIYNI